MGNPVVLTRDEGLAGVRRQSELCGRIVITSPRFDLRAAMEVSVSIANPSRFPSSSTLSVRSPRSSYSVSPVESSPHVVFRIASASSARRGRASALADFLRYYNEDRFHMGINGCTPMQRLAGHP